MLHTGLVASKLQLALARHSTHRLPTGLHTAVVPPQSEPLVHPQLPVTHALLAVPAVQLAHIVPHEVASVLDAQVVPVQQLPVAHVPVPGP